MIPSGMIPSRMGAIALMTLALAAMPGTGHVAPGKAPEAPPRATGPQEVEVVAVLVEPRQGTPTVVLRGKRDHRQLALAIGHAEALGIAVPLQGVTPPRPLTHDLFLTLFGRLKVELKRVVITELRDDIYYATVHLTAGGVDHKLDARPSDAIALAIRAKVPVLVEERVFEQGGGPTARTNQI